MSAFSSMGQARLVLDPRTKLLMVIVINVVMLSGGFSGVSAIVRPLCAAVPLVLLLVESRWKAAGGYFLFNAVALVVELFLVERTHGALNLILIIFSGLVSRFVPGFVMGYYFVSTTKISQLVAAMERMHIPQKIIIPFAVMIRFFPTVGEENAAISDAMRMRGLRIGGGSAGSMLEYRLVPLLMSTVKIGEELSASALTRGLGAPTRRTNICHIGLGVQDVVLLVAFTAAFAAFLLL